LNCPTQIIGLTSFALEYKFYRCQRFTINQYKVRRKGSKRKEQSNRRLPWSGTPDTVRCTRVDSLQLASFGNLGRLLHYNSPDCPVHQAEQRLQAPTVVCNSTRTVNSVHYARRSQSRRQKAHQTVNSDCPVHHRTVRWPHLSELQRSEPNGLVTWLAHRTVRCPIRQQPPPRALLVVGAINTPQPPHFNASKFFSHQTSYKSSRLHSKTQSKRSNPLPSPESLQPN
jgi:hypothetical protein